MKIYRLFWIAPVVLALLLGMSVYDGTFAGTTGKLTGRVTDASSGDPLPGVSVVIEGTRRGTVTDGEGYYLILSIDPGMYTLMASLIGYNAVTKTGVRIQADFTTTLNFQLKETAIEAEELVVTAERPPVEPDKTTSHYVMSAEQIGALPMARSVEDLVTLQPGVNLTNAGIIRGGDSREEAFLVDGIRLQNNDVYGRQFRGVNKTAIQEITVISGGASAEYGNLESGAISVVTKDGGKNFRGWADLRYTPPGKRHWGGNIYHSAFHRGKMQWDDSEWRAETVVLDPGEDGVEGTADDQIGLAHREVEYTDAKGSYIEGGLSGPVGDRASFFGTARWTKQPNQLIAADLHTPFDIRGNLKLTFRPAPNLKISVGEVYSVAEGFNRGTNVSRNLSSNGRNVFLPDGSGAGEARITDNITYGLLTHTISPKMFYEVKLARYSTVEDTMNITNKRDQFGFPVPTFAEKDLDAWFNVRPATGVDFTLAERTRLSLKADLSSQVTKGHFVKTGLELIRYDLYYYRYIAPTASSRQVYYVNEPGNLPNVNAPIHPIQMAFYVQDKMEFEGMVLNAGVRLDAFYSNTRFYTLNLLQTPQYRWLNKKQDMPTIDPVWTGVISPRFGISHPITDRSAFHFTAGLYTRMFNLDEVFQERWLASGPDEHEPWDAFNGLRAQNRAMGPWVKFVRTRAYEAGADWNFTADYIVGVAAYFKSQIGHYRGSSFYFYAPEARSTWVWGVRPNSQQDMKGVELHVRKGFSHLFSFNAAINFGWASWQKFGPHGVLNYPDSAYVASDQYHDWEWNGTQYVPKHFTPAEREKMGSTINSWWRSRARGITDFHEFMMLDFLDLQKAFGAPEGFRGAHWATWGARGLNNPKSQDRRTQASLSLYYDSPKDFGPGLRGFHVIGGLRANLVWRIQSGLPVNYTPPGKQVEKRHKPLRTWADLQAEKTLVSSGSRDAIFYVEVTNLFNQRDSVNPGNYPDYVRWGLLLPRPNDVNYETYGNYRELTLYAGRPREVGVGFKVNF